MIMNSILNIESDLFNLCLSMKSHFSNIIPDIFLNPLQMFSMLMCREISDVYVCVYDVYTMYFIFIFVYNASEILLTSFIEQIVFPSFIFVER